MQGRVAPMAKVIFSSGAEGVHEKGFYIGTLVLYPLFFSGDWTIISDSAIISGMFRA